MELILKTDNENSIAKIIALAKSLNVYIEQRNHIIEDQEREELKKRILNYKGTSTSSFDDPAKWERNERLDRDLPFPK